MKRVCIVGGGASGLVAAIEAGKDVQVTIFEKKEQLGKKLSITGNGKCNLINDDQNRYHFHSRSSACVSEILDYFSKEDLLDLFCEYGIVTYERNGYHYPLSNQASTVVKVLSEMLSENTTIKLSEEVKYISKDNNIFTVKTDKGSYKFDKVIISAGSPAGLSVKEIYNGKELIKQLDHKLIPFKPALCGLTSEDKITKYWSGIRTDGIISIYKDNELLRSERGELMLVEDGISGIAAFQLSHYVCSNCYVLIDYLPTLSVNEVFAYLLRQRKLNPDRPFVKALYGLINIKLAESLLTEATFRLDSLKGLKSYWIKLSDFDDEKIKQFILFIKAFKVNITGTRDYKDSQVCSGGVSLTDIDTDTCESKNISGLYITGEMLDVAGDCGGYNLQWAFTTGVLAGRAVGK